MIIFVKTIIVAIGRLCPSAFPISLSICVSFSPCSFAYFICQSPYSLVFFLSPYPVACPLVPLFVPSSPHSPLPSQACPLAYLSLLTSLCLSNCLIIYLFSLRRTCLLVPLLVSLSLRPSAWPCVYLLISSNICLYLPTSAYSHITSLVSAWSPIPLLIHQSPVFFPPCSLSSHLSPPCPFVKSEN